MEQCSAEMKKSEMFVGLACVWGGGGSGVALPFCYWANEVTLRDGANAVELLHRRMFEFSPCVMFVNIKFVL